MRYAGSPSVVMSVRAVLTACARLRQTPVTKVACSTERNGIPSPASVCVQAASRVGDRSCVTLTLRLGVEL